MGALLKKDGVRGFGQEIGENRDFGVFRGCKVAFLRISRVFMKFLSEKGDCGKSGNYRKKVGKGGV